MHNRGLKRKAINIAAVCTAIFTITAFTGCDIPQQGSALPGNTQGASALPSQTIGQPAQVEIPSEVKSGTVEGRNVFLRLQCPSPAAVNRRYYVAF